MKKLGLHREFIGGLSYSTHIIFNYPKSTEGIDTSTIYKKDGLEIWLDKKKGKTLGIEIHYHWRENEKTRNE